VRYNDLIGWVVVFWFVCFFGVQTTYRTLPLISACSIAVSAVRLQQQHNDIVNFDVPLDDLVTGLCLCASEVGGTRLTNFSASSDANPSSDSNIYVDLMRLVADLCANVVCRSSSLLNCLGVMLSRKQLTRPFAACLTARIPVLIDATAES
jgi:hypothetical protein